MNIIVVSNRLAKAITLGSREIVVLLVGAVLVLGGCAFMLGLLVAPSKGAPIWRLIPGDHAKQSEIDSLAKRLGELQAKQIRMDGLVERVGKQAGIDVKPYLSNQSAPVGGGAMSGKSLSAAELNALITMADEQMARHTDLFTIAESAFNVPVAVVLKWPLLKATGRSSSFGWRVDPFGGRQVFHEGLDLLADVGTPIMAAADGTVVTAEYHPQYGNMVDIDHGNGLLTRYAHAMKLNVKVGDKVKAGQVVSFLGNTGSSTGPHLHFELRYKGVPQNPLRFLDDSQVAVVTDK